MKSDRKGKAEAAAGRGSLTVEASFLFPWLVILTALLLVMTFYACSLNWYRAGAIEASLYGNARHPGEDGKAAASERAQLRVRQAAMPGSDPSFTVVYTEAACEVAYTGQKFPAFSSLFSWEVSEKTDRVRPVRLLRKARAVKEAFGE